MHAQASAAAFPMLSDIPQLRALYSENSRQEARMTAYLAAVEAALCDKLRKGERPGAELVEAVAAAKVGRTALWDFDCVC